eukprot:m.95922 g.95922  ORF g.95922 m.95922 type:complete len:70 (+) comp14775_c0_seq5:2814-3023(+)
MSSVVYTRRVLFSFLSSTDRISYQCRRREQEIPPEHAFTPFLEDHFSLVARIFFLFKLLAPDSAALLLR